MPELGYGYDNLASVVDVLRFEMKFLTLIRINFPQTIVAPTKVTLISVYC